MAKPTFEDTLPEELKPEVIVHPVVAPPTNPAHNWKQRGFMVVCDTCNAPHSIQIAHDEIFRGVKDDGSLIIEKIVAAQPKNVA